MRVSVLMRTGFFAATALFSHVSANANGSGGDLSSLSSLPKCATGCVNTAFTGSGCQPTDVSCICKATTFLSSIACCVATACSPSDAQTILGFADQLCGAYGISFPPPDQLCSSSSAPPSTPASTPASTSVPPQTTTSATVVSATTTITSSTCPPTSSTALTSTSSPLPQTTTSTPPAPPVCPTTCPPAVTSYITVTPSSSTTVVPGSQTTPLTTTTPLPAPVVGASGSSAGAVGTQTTSSKPLQFTGLANKVELGSGAFGIAGIVAAVLL